jgi:signal transduction histidine kinase
MRLEALPPGSPTGNEKAMNSWRTYKPAHPQSDVTIQEPHELGAPPLVVVGRRPVPRSQPGDTMVPEALPSVRPGWRLLTGAACVVALGACALHRFRLERMLELQRMRTRIATDLHDDIGSSLTQIAILSEVAERRMNGPDPAVVEPISRVSLISRELVDSMSEIVWAINPRHDRVQDLASRMRRFAADMLTAGEIALRFRTPDGVQNAVLDADLRRQLLLIFKEAIHNAVRHSRCTEVQVDLGLEHRRLVLSISDNGQGFDSRHTPAGHGLRSMEARANSLVGRVEIDSAPGRGTTIRAIVPLARRAVRVRKAS